ncbi:MAG: aldehyde ferredoxin oxidoreductase family protein [Dehalococcoidia bacterium]
MANGYAGQILRVDLTNGDWEIEDLDLDLAKKFIGARGLGAKILMDEVDPKIDPLSPENKLIFLAGALTGTGAVCGCRYMVVSKSPLTGAIGYSGASGFFGPEMKFAGYDVIIFEGKSEKPVYLSIDDDEIELKTASHLWGKTTIETEGLIKAELGDEWVAMDTHVASIGPAGENLVKFACIISDGGAAIGRTGLGAVMGSKNLKAVAVRGTKGIQLADGETFRRLVRETVESVLTNPMIGPGGIQPRYGTSATMVAQNNYGLFPTRNYSRGTWEPAENELSPDRIRDALLVRNKGCYSCPVGCKRISRSAEPRFEGRGEGPEYEVFALFGAGCDVTDVFALAKAGFICNEMGLDIIEAGNTMACAMDLYERGFLPEADAGCKLNFGNAEAMVELVKKIGLREGFGDALAEGGYRLAEKYGHPDVYVGAKKMGCGGHHPRSAQALGLTYATSNRGACYMAGYPPEVIQVPDATETPHQAGRVIIAQNQMAVVDSMGLCYIMFYGLLPEDTAPVFSAATGFGYTWEDLLHAGERIWNLERLFNLRAGFTKADDNVGRRMEEEPSPDGPAEGKVLRLGEMLPEYYQLRGWDENGIPTEEKLAALGLD